MLHYIFCVSILYKEACIFNLRYCQQETLSAGNIFSVFPGLFNMFPSFMQLIVGIKSPLAQKYGENLELSMLTATNCISTMEHQESASAVITLWYVVSLRLDTFIDGKPANQTCPY